MTFHLTVQYDLVPGQSITAILISSEAFPIYRSSEHKGGVQCTQQENKSVATVNNVSNKSQVHLLGVSGSHRLLISVDVGYDIGYLLNNPGYWYHISKAFTAFRM